MSGFTTEDTDWESGQRQLSAVLVQWRSSEAAVPVLAALGEFARGAAMGDCRPLAGLFGGDAAIAGDVIGGLVDGVVNGLARSPLGQLPLRHARRKTSHTLLLARDGTASLAITVYDGVALAAQPTPHSAEFAPIETWVRVLAGTGTAERVTRDTEYLAPLQRAEVDLRPGVMLKRDGWCEGLQMRAVDGALVVLRLQRQLRVPDTVHEFRLEDGALLHRAAARSEDSRLELAIAVLVAQGRRDAVPALARIVTGSAPVSLRWSALRAVLGLDTRAGLVLLGELAGGEDEVLGAAARGLQRDLIDEWPELEKVAQWRG